MSNENTPEIQLTLGEEKSPQLQMPAAEKRGEIVNLEESNLSEAEKQQVREFSKQIDLRDSRQVLQYGMSSQRKISEFSERALGKVRTKDTGEIGDVLVRLTGELRGFTDEPEKKGFLGFIKKGTNQLATMKTRYASVESNINRISDSLENHRVQLLKDVTMLDEMYDINLTYFKELTMYILAGRERLLTALDTELPAMKKRAEETGLQEDAQAARDFEEMCNRFDKKLYDLDLTRTISMQMAPQIRMVQSNDSILVEKIQTSIVNTIPLWKNQMTLALGLANSQQALQAQRAVTDTTNELLKKNAEMLKRGTVETAREAERGIVDIETLRNTNQQLISTIQEVIQIQEEGRQNRRQAEVELVQIEEELKQTLLSASSQR